ncbi:MAG TPA: hypothetical protein VF099_13990, partial [Ktedonobacterales bacterium]
EWTRKIAQEGDIQLARRLATSCDSPDLDRFIAQQQQTWLKQTQAQLQQAEHALDRASLPLGEEDHQRIDQIRATVRAAIKEARFHVARSAIQQLTGELDQMLQRAVLLQQERRRQALDRVRAARDRFYESALSLETSEISEQSRRLLDAAERLALRTNLSDADLERLDLYCVAAIQLCEDPTSTSSATRDLLEALAAAPISSGDSSPALPALPPTTGRKTGGRAAPQPAPAEPPPAIALPDRSAEFPAPPGGWTTEADTYLIDFYLSHPDEDLAQHLSVPVESIRARIETLGLVGLRQAGVRAPRGRELRQESWANPYVPGQPITTLKMFYGRERDLEYIRSNLSHNEGEDQSRVIILEGHRRTGKTSLLHHLEGKKSAPSILAPRVPVYLPIDSYIPFTSASLFYKMSYTIYQALHRREHPIAQPRLSDYQHDFGMAWHHFLDAAEESTGGPGLVLMFDEFQIIEERRAAGDLDKDVYWVLRADMQGARHIDFILAGTMRLEDIVRQHDAALFGIGPIRILRSLDDQNARRLITEPARDQKIIYDEDAVDLIVALTSSYPYYIQLLCSVLFNYLNERQKRHATRPDVERVLPTVLEEGSTQFTSILFANDVSLLERCALAGSAELIDTPSGSCHRERLFELLRDKKLVTGQIEFDQALRQLTLRDLMKDGDGGAHIAFQVDLFRQWIRAHKPLDRVVREERERQQSRRN